MIFKKQRKNLRRALKVLFVLLVGVNAWIVISGNTYLYKAIAYNYVNLDDYKIFHNRKIEASTEGKPLPFSANYDDELISDSLIRKLEEIETVAFLVIKNDSVYYERYWQGYSDTTLSNSFSMAKSYISALIGIALEEGHIESLDEPVGNYLPEFKKGKKSNITIKHVLWMSSGLYFGESYSSPFSNTTKLYYGTDVYKLVTSLKVIKAPGEAFSYSSGDTQILAAVLRAATGKNVADYASEKLWKPLGCVRDGLWCLDKEDGFEKAYCCVNSNARDFALFGLMYMNDGFWNGQQIVTKNYVRESLKPCLLPDKKNEVTNYYGYQWWMYPEKGEQTFYARGLKGQYIFCFPEKNMVVVRLGKKRAGKRGNHPLEVHWIMEEIAKF